jgi:oxygen-independent coproporphyrinogen-3 oxidase
MADQNLSVQVNLAAFTPGKAGADDRRRYVQALKAEIACAADYADDYTIDALYIAGPHPFQYPADGLADILQTLAETIPIQPNAEITIDALPGSVTFYDLRILQGQGVNRLRFDMQTFVQAELDALERTYAPSAIEVFMKMVNVKLTFFNYDVTLRYGLPGQTLESFAYSIEQAIQYQAMHITLLPAIQGKPAERSAFYRLAAAVIGQTSFQQYSPYHWARPGYFSRWVQSTYANQPLLGLGVGAQSTIDGQRCVNVSDVEAYIAAHGDPSKAIAHAEALAPASLLANQILDRWFNLHVCPRSAIAPELSERIQSLCGQGLLIANDAVVLLTDAGKQDWKAVETAMLSSAS